MNIRKGLSLTAYGFLFILINFNLVMEGRTINVIPDFIGWILLFLAFGKLGDYTKGCGWLRWLALILVIPSAYSWLISLIKPELVGSPGLATIETLASIGELVFIVLMFTPLIRIAHDYGSDREEKFKKLRIVNLIMYAIFICVSVLVTVFRSRIDVTGPSGALVIIAVVTTAAGIALLVCAVITAISVFKLKNEVAEKTA